MKMKVIFLKLTSLLIALKVIGLILNIIIIYQVLKDGKNVPTDANIVLNMGLAFMIQNAILLKQMIIVMKIKAIIR